MEEHKIDSLVKKALNESGNFYDAEAIKAENRIWNQIHPQQQVKPLYIRFLAAASILLFIGLSAVTFYNMKQKSAINELVESNVLLKKDLMIYKQNLLTNKETMAASYKLANDTIYIEKKVLQKPLVTTQYITDTVYIKQIIYVEKEPEANLITVNDTSSSLDSSSIRIKNNYQSDIIISNNESAKKKKPKKMKIKFGGNRSQNRKGTLALTTKPK
ncbi:hypothetical protein QWY87_06035 [Lutimonas halocynthiae]|uniref:hypothetical protein n=1 Tax=Lutimonas halocynthiae TaxID=1446477 RepID=UPI0025B359C7|nr:hypothetical protein [Lutimonas halocynthiae]MDN3642250.1 hypothetical protein [Lutimonas halocynthiae]